MTAGVFVCVSGGSGLPGFPGRPGPPGETVGSDIPGPLGDPGLPGLDGEYGKYISSIQIPFRTHLLSSPLLLLTLSSVFKVSKVLQVLPGRLVQAQHRETEVTLGSRAFPAPLVQKENQATLEAPGSLAAPVSKVTWSFKQK